MVKEFRPCEHISSFEELDFNDGSWFAEPKIDGIWIKIFLNKNKIRAVSRHGLRKVSIEKWFEGDDKLIKFLSRSHLVLIGEAEYGQQKSIEMSKGRLPVVWVFDIYPFRDYLETRKILKRVCSLSKRLRLVPSVKVNSPAHAQKLYEKFVRDGWEGIVLKRNGKWFKKKKEILKKFKIVGVEWSESRYKAIKSFSVPKRIISALVVETKNGNTFRVGSMDMETRIEISRNPGKFVGKTALVKGFEEFKSGALRHPSLVKIL
jgi:ATP-dependent DNA ligase